MRTVQLKLKQASAVLEIPPKELQNLVQFGVLKPKQRAGLFVFDTTTLYAAKVALFLKTALGTNTELLSEFTGALLNRLPSFPEEQAAILVFGWGPKRNYSAEGIARRIYEIRRRQSCKLRLYPREARRFSLRLCTTNPEFLRSARRFLLLVTRHSALVTRGHFGCGHGLRCASVVQEVLMVSTGVVSGLRRARLSRSQTPVKASGILRPEQRPLSRGEQLQPGVSRSADRRPIAS